MLIAGMIVELSDSEDHYSDAQSGIHSPSSPIPVTRVEKVDNEPSYGEVPGTDAYKKRVEDAQPDEIAVIEEDKTSDSRSTAMERPSTPGGRPIPITVIEKVDPSMPSYGEVPGTTAHNTRKTDAAPDVIVKVSDTKTSLQESLLSRPGTTPGGLPIPTTKVEKVDLEPSHGEVPGTVAYDMRKGDAKPDVVEEVGDIQGKKLIS